MDLKSHQFISFFEPEQANQLCNIATVEQFPHQTIIFEEGEIPDFLYLVLAGKVVFRKQIDSAQYQTVATAIPDDFFGEFGILDGQPRSAQALVCEGATVAKIPIDILMDVLESSRSSAILKLFRYVIQRLRVTTEDYVKHLAYKDKMVLVGEMVNTIIHDLKSPLSGIHLSSSMLQELHEDEETLEWCDLIQEQAKRMSAMAEELLAFARGTPVLHKQPVRLAKALRHFEKLNHIYFQQANVDLIIDCPDDAIADVDEGKLMRVVQNLAINAVEAFVEKGGRVEVALKPFPDKVQITICDNGPGIPEDIRDTFFEPFVTHGKQRGTGLGTAIAKSIIDAHGGSIYFQSTAEQGTTFYITLPRATS